MSYFDRIAKSDVHIVLDHVVLSKGDFVNRTRIRQRDGRVMWLTIPCEKGKPINETPVQDGRWRQKHLDSLYQCYGARLATDISGLIRCEYATLDKMCWASLRWINDAAGGRQSPWAKKEMVFSSILGGTALGAGSDLILNLCKEVGATTYLSGPNGRDYLDLPAFEKAGIGVEWHDYPVVQPVLSAVHDLFSKERVAV